VCKREDEELASAEGHRGPGYEVSSPILRRRLKPVAIKTRRGQRYALGIIDDASRFMWISAMREMTEVNGMFAARIGREER
jgi:hypothetical protein